MPTVDELLRAHGGSATTSSLLTVVTRGRLDSLVRQGHLIRVWHGVYSASQPDLVGRLAALDMVIGDRAVACMGTAAALHDFDVESRDVVHILDPGRRVRPTRGLRVHQRDGAPLSHVNGRLVTAPAWTAVEVARTQKPPRALATLDAALHVDACDIGGLRHAIEEQRGRRGIVAVRALLELADGRAESAMESEARLAMHEQGLPRPELQYVIDGPVCSWRVDFAWPEQRVVAEYDSVEWHAGRADMLRDRARFAAIQQLGWTVIPIVVTDVRLHPRQLAERIAVHLARAAA